MSEAEVLKKRRWQLLEIIAVSADEIKVIDNRLTILQNQELEEILIQAEPGARA